MAEFAKDVYIREVKGQFGDFYSISIKLSDFIEWAKDKKDNKGYIHLVLCQTKDKDKWYMKLDTWDHEKKQNASTLKTTPKTEEEQEIPF